MKRTLLIFSLFLLILKADAQFYQKSLGLRLNQKDYGVVFRSHIYTDYAVDICTSFSSGSFIASTLFEREKAILHKRFFVKAGAGVHLGAMNPQAKGLLANDTKTGSMLAGIRAITGFEWIDIEKKLTIGFDIIPCLELADKSFGYVLFAITGNISIDEAFNRNNNHNADTP